MENDELDVSDDLEDDITFDEEGAILANVEDLTSAELCDIVVAFRYLGFFRERAIACMKELAKRRTNGDSFEFEKVIDSAVKELPVLSKTNRFITR